MFPLSQTYRRSVASTLLPLLLWEDPLKEAAHLVYTFDSKIRPPTALSFSSGDRGYRLSGYGSLDPSQSLPSLPSARLPSTSLHLSRSVGRSSAGLSLSPDILSFVRPACFSLKPKANDRVPPCSYSNAVKGRYRERFSPVTSIQARPPPSRDVGSISPPFFPPAAPGRMFLAPERYCSAGWLRSLPHCRPFFFDVR